MEEKQKKKPGLWKKVVLVVLGLATGTLGYATISQSRKRKRLEKKNQELILENQSLFGEIHSKEKEIRKLSHDLANAQFQLGKESMKRNF